MYAQQGDLLLKLTGSLPDNAKEIKTDLIHKGDNHHHRMRGDFQVFECEGEMLVFCKEAELFHEEHKTIKMPEGLYQKSIVMEYDHFLEESRRVID